MMRILIEGLKEKMMDFKVPGFVYSSGYYADIGQHVFPLEKYRLIKERLIREGLLEEEDFLEPEPATLEDLLLVHTPEYMQDLFSLRWTHRTLYSELPLTEEIVRAFTLAAGGTILACQKALELKIGFNIGGGFHHAFPDHAEGFCYINDIAVGVARMKKDGKIKKGAVVDCDLHQGNGTAVIFQKDPTVFTFSIHQENLYPIKQRSDLDIGLPDFTNDEAYLGYLSPVVPKILEEHKPDLVVYQAGADPYERDQLGSLKLTLEGLKQRDEFVINECMKRDIPLAIVLGGGYAFNTLDTVTIHFQTSLSALEALTKSQLNFE